MPTGLRDSDWRFSGILHQHQESQVFVERRTGPGHTTDCKVCAYFEDPFSTFLFEKACTPQITHLEERVLCMRRDDVAQLRYG